MEDNLIEEPKKLLTKELLIDILTKAGAINKPIIMSSRISEKQIVNNRHIWLETAGVDVEPLSAGGGFVKRYYTFNALWNDLKEANYIYIVGANKLIGNIPKFEGIVVEPVN